MNIKIDKEFKNLIQPLSADEFAQLEANIITEGCRDSLVVWSDDRVLIDGHNRHKICQHHDIEFEVIDIELETRDEVIEWIISNQLGRRNLTADQMAYLRGEKYNRINKGWGGKRSSGKTCHLMDKTSSKLAKEYGTSEKTIRNDAVFANAVNLIAENIGEDIKKKILTREINIGRAKIIELSKLSSEQQEKILIDGQSFEDAVKQIESAKKKQSVSKEKITTDNCSAIEWFPQQKPCDLLLTAPTESADIEWLSIALNKVKKTGHAFIITRNNPEQIRAYLNADIPTVWRVSDMFAWIPVNANKGDVYSESWMPIIHFSTTSSNELTYPTDKMVINNSKDHIALIEKLIRASTKEGEVVYDCFAWSNVVMEIGGGLGRECKGCWQEE